MHVSEIRVESRPGNLMFHYRPTTECFGLGGRVDLVLLIKVKPLFVSQEHLSTCVLYLRFFFKFFDICKLQNNIYNKHHHDNIKQISKTYEYKYVMNRCI